MTWCKVQWFSNNDTSGVRVRPSAASNHLPVKKANLDYTLTLNAHQGSISLTQCLLIWLQDNETVFYF